MHLPNTGDHMLVLALPARAAHLLSTGSVPDPSPDAPPAIKEKVDLLLALLRYGVIAACVAGVFLVAGKAALAHRRGELHDVMGQLGAVLVACVLVASGSALVSYIT
jgi:hypothetical protein